MRGSVARVLALVGLVGVLAWVVPGVGVAAGGRGEGYCTPDGQPVVTYRPPTWDDNWTIECVNGEIQFRHETIINPIVVNTAPLEQPPDFGRWVDILFNGQWMTNPYKDVEPFVARSSGRTLIPLRYVSEAFGAKVDWDNSTRTATITWQESEIEVKIGDPQASIAGREVALDQPPVIWKDRTMVPLRFVVEAFGASVEWNNASSEVIVTMRGVECAPTYCRN